MAIQSFHQAVVARKNAGGGTVTVPLNALQTFEAGSDGNALTAAMLNSAETGDAWTWTAPIRDPGAHTYIETTGIENYGADVVNIEGSPFTPGTRCIKFDHTEAASEGLSPPWDEFVATPPESITKCVFSGFLYFGATGAAEVTYEPWRVSASPYLVLQQQMNPTGDPNVGTAGRVHIETQHNGGMTDRSAPIAIDVGPKHVEMWFNNDTGAMGMILRDATTMAFFGCSFYVSNDSAGTPLTNAGLTDYLTPTAGYTLHDNFGRTWKPGDIAFPLFPLTDLAAPSGVTLTQTAAGTVELVWDDENAKGTFKIEIHNGTSWSTLETAIHSVTTNSGTTENYTESGLTDGLTYKMRVTAQMGSASSAAVESNTVTIDDDPFSGAWTDAIAPGSTDTGEPMDSFVIYQRLALPSGTAGRLRVYTTANSVAMTGKIKLYNSSQVLIGTATPTKTAGAAGYVEGFMDSPVSVSAGNYWIGFIGSNSTGDARYLNASGTAKYKFITYAAFDNTSPFSEDGNITPPRTYAVGAYIY